MYKKFIYPFEHLFSAAYQLLLQLSGSYFQPLRRLSSTNSLSQLVLRDLNVRIKMAVSIHFIHFGRRFVFIADAYPA